MIPFCLHPGATMGQQAGKQRVAWQTVAYYVQGWAVNGQRFKSLAAWTFGTRTFGQAVCQLQVVEEPPHGCADGLCLLHFPAPVLRGVPFLRGGPCQYCAHPRHVLVRAGGAVLFPGEDRQNGR